MKFTLNVDDARNIKDYLSIIQTVDTNEIIFRLIENKLYIINSAGNAYIKIGLDVTNADNNDNIDAFSLSNNILDSMISFIITSSNEEVEIATINEEKIKVISDNNSLATFALSISTIDYHNDELFNRFLNSKKEVNNIINLTITPEILSYLNLILAQSNYVGSNNRSFCIDGKFIEYHDLFCVVDKQLEKTTGIPRNYFPIDIIPVISSLTKKFDSLTIEYDPSCCRLFTSASKGNFKYYSMTCYSFTYEDMTDDDLKSITPKNTSTVNIPTEDLVRAINSFNSVFPVSIWQWKDITFSYNDGAILLHHVDPTISRDVSASIQADAKNQKDFDINISTTLLLNILNEYKPETIQITVDIEDEEKAIKVSLDKCDIYLCQILK